MNFIRNFFNPHRHKWELVACNDQYHTEYTDLKTKKYWDQRFYKCSCGLRKHESNNPTSHRGIESAKKNWIDAGVVPTGSYHPGTSTGYIKIDGPPEEQVDPIQKLNHNLEDMMKFLGVVKRDVDLEQKYPKLKKSADEYFRLLDKYRMVENLKGPNDT